MRFVVLSLVVASACACSAGQGSSVASAGTAGTPNTNGGGSSTGGSNSSGGSKATGGSNGTGGAASDGKGPWVPVDGGSRAAFFMAAAPHTNLVYYWDSNQKKLFGTSDKGATWTALASTTTDGKAVDAGMLRAVFDPADATDNTFWIGGIYGASGIYHTTDGGKSFTSTCFAHTQNFSVDLTDPARKLILATDHGGAFFMSTDGGATCTPALAKLQAADAGITRANVPFVVDTQNLLVTTGGYGGTDGFWRSTDGGTTWKKVSTQTASQPILVGPDGSYFYGLFWNRGLMQSKDKGVTWAQNVGYGSLDAALESVCGALLDDGRMVWIKAATQSGNQQLLVSTDYKTFKNFLSPFPTVHMDWADQNLGVVYSHATNSLYTYTRYGKISRWDL